MPIILVKKQGGRILAFMKYLRLLLLFLGFAGFAQQGIQLVETSNWAIKADAFIGFDNFGCAYYVRDNVFIKTDRQQSVEYKSVALGKITRADLSNPLQIVLFYEDFNTVILLDNQLNETRRILFSDNEIPIIATAVGMAAQNKLWIYNSLSQKIGLYDYVNQNYHEITLAFKGKPSLYQSDFNYFYWIGDSEHLMRTDIYGKVFDFGVTQALDGFVITANSWLISFKGDVLSATNLTTSQNYQIATGQKSFKSLHYHAQILSIFTTEGISNYKITLP